MIFELKFYKIYIMKEIFIFGKIQRKLHGIETNIYDDFLPLKIIRNRPDGIIRQLLTMMKYELNSNQVYNFIKPYLIN